MKKLLSLMNDNHWYLIAACVAAGFVFWIHGCHSKVASVLEPNKQVTRAELQLEANYIIGQIEVKMTNLDQQDAVKVLLLEQAAIFGKTGTFNPAGLLNTVISIGAISFGLNRNQKYKKEKSSKENT